ncbi:DUF6879 family protein [Amycolatopsis anabasis]|uniref:DUF6879 family protein n=1 Tax=Amycolatopsis anabasis TaxID=1840409 RepID=UPI00131DE046|nr:DUF6879 family protein [Amycolatopsis anabasis]
MSLLIGDDFQQLFKDFELTAFRLEVRDRYNAPHESESLRQFLAGEEEDRDLFAGWYAMIGEIVAAGKRFERVRVVSRPPSDYNRYGYWSSQFNNAAGEDIRYLARDQAEGLPTHDYWLFDSRKLVRMHFNDDDDTFVGAEVVDDPVEIVRHNYWRDLAWHRAVRREEFAIE